MKKGNARKIGSRLRYIFPLFVILLIVIVCIGISKNSGKLNNNSDGLNEKATGYMSEKIEKLKNEDDENLISTKYLVTDNVIKRVKENTSIDEFKKSFEREVKIYTDEAMDEEITDGIIKTGMVVADKEDTYIAIVDGDVSKDGKVDQIDVSKMVRKETEEIGKVETSEYGIEKIARKIVYKEYELDKVKEVEKPEIKLVSGQKGENEWYTTDVELEINQKEEQGKKTVYKIKGTEEKEETQIEEGQKITIDKDGIYKVIAYTYGEEGNKSRIAYEIIKVNKTGIEAAINYSTTESTTDPVTATVTFNKEGIKITNNEGKNTYEFTENGEFTFEYVDEAGRTGSITAKVDWIKKKEVIGQDGEWKYFVNSDNTIQLTQYLGTKTELVVPAKYDGYEVYAIGQQDVNDNSPASQRYNVLGEKTLSNSTITKLTIEEGIKEIKASAFNQCTGIKGSLVIPEGVTKIGTLAFNKCSGFNGTLTLPSTLKSIGNGAFQLCSGFTGDLVIPEGVEILGTHVFNKCNGFNGTLTLPSTLKSIGKTAFQSCTNLKGDIIIPEKIEIINKYTFNGCSGFNGTLELPSNLKSIENTAFQNCSGLTGKLVIPDGVEIIDNLAFSGCSSLDGTITLPSGLKTIGEASFDNCSKLTGPLNLPDTIESIGQFAFNNCSSLTGDLIIPNSLTTISRAAFQSCSKLTGKLVLPDTITSIEGWAFYDDKFTGNLNLPKNLESMGEAAFGKNTGFSNTKIIIPYSLKKIGIDCEFNGENLGLSTHDFYNFGANFGKFEEYEVEEKNENFVAVDGVLYSKDKKRMLLYPRNKKGDTYEILEGVVTLDEFAFASNMNLENLIVPDSLTLEPRKQGIRSKNVCVLTSALYSYTSIKNIIIKDSNLNYTSIDGVVYTKDLKELVYVAAGRTNEVIIPDGVETIRSYSTFSSQVGRKVSKMYIPNSVINIADIEIELLNNGFIRKIEVAEDNPAFTLDGNGKLVRK